MLVARSLLGDTMRRWKAVGTHTLYDIKILAIVRVLNTCIWTYIL